jgi:hypothetical protein
MKQDLGTQFFATNAFDTNKFLYSFTFGMQFNLKNSHRIMRLKNLSRIAHVESDSLI